MLSSLFLICTAFTCGLESQEYDNVTRFAVESRPATEVTTGLEEQLIIKAHGEGINDLAFSTNGEQIATCSRDRTIRLWNTKTGEYIRGFVTGGEVLAIRFSPDGKRLVACTIDHGLHVFDTTVWESKVVGKSIDQPQVIRFSPDGKIVAVGTEPIALFDADSFKPIGRLEGHVLGGSALEFSNDGAFLVSGNADRHGKVWDVGNQKLRFDREHDYWVTGVDVSPNGKVIAMASFKRNQDSQIAEIELIDPNTGDVVDKLVDEILKGHIHSNIRVRFTPDGLYLISLLDGNHDTGKIADDIILTEPEGNICIWNMDTKRLVAKKTTNNRAYRLDVGPSSSSFAIAVENGTLEIWNIDSFVAANRVGEQ